MTSNAMGRNAAQDWRDPLRHAVLVFLSVIFSISAAPTAFAATSSFAIFPDRIFATPGVIGGANLFGNTPAETTFLPGGIALFDFGEDISSNTFMIDVTSVAGPTEISVRYLRLNGLAVSETAPGSFPFASPIDVVLSITAPGTFTVPSSSFVGACAAIGGCNSVLFNATGANSFTANVVSSAPEPAAWALMLVSFFGVAFRMKTIRARGAFTPSPALA